ncbi:hypothetical protein [Leucobacter chromiiresistens]|uniref:Uncharacterized protein n=1 Tax=Leucobacter chromiiresistens TaxID=1079994 RepID=A0A1H1A2M6_9MICO|nr:hypothetical protein [Leucobacter chromiiresistens]SDQ33761.1 hypothetical protein SAMN04488565_2274 [Leucobacter chromiiresistens]
MGDDSRHIARFLTEIVRLSRMQEHFPFLAEATAVVDGDVAIVVYREEAGGRLLGRCFHYPSLARGFDGSSPEIVADAIVVNDLADPSRPGAVHRYAWERALVATDEPVQWLSTPLSAGVTDAAPAISRHFLNPEREPPTRASEPPGDARAPRR